MDIRVLEYYLMVAREENITNAANLLHVTQPTLSRQLMQLEKELGVKLFERSNHNINLTEDGLMLKRRAQEIVALANRTKQDFMKGTTDLTGEIAIGSGEFQSVDLLSKIMSAFREEHPLVTFSLFSSNSTTIKERIEAGLLDIGLIFDYVDISRYEYLRFPIDEEWGVMVHEKSKLAKKDAVTPKDIRELPLIISERSMMDNALSDWLGISNYDEVNIIATYNLLYNAAIMVANGVGVAGCIKLKCQYENVRFIPAKPMVKNSAVLAWKKTSAHSNVVAEFIEFAKKYILSMAGNKK